MGHEHILSTDSEALEFMLSGYAIVTLESQKTGKRFTFKITRPKGKNKAHLRYVCLLSGPNNHKDYTYMGHITGGKNFNLQENGRIGKDAESYKAFVWTFRELLLNSLKQRVLIYRYNFCGRCGELLTTPKSITDGYGPVCVKRVMQSRTDRNLRNTQLSLM